MFGASEESSRGLPRSLAQHVIELLRFTITFFQYHVFSQRVGIYLLVLNVFGRPPKNTKTQDPSHPFEFSHLSHLAAGGGGARDACACRPDMQSVPHSPLFLLFWQAPGVRHGTPSSIPAIAVQLVAARFSTRNPRTAALDMQGMIFRFHFPPVVHRTSAWKPRRDGCAARRVRRSQRLSRVFCSEHAPCSAPCARVL